MSHFSVMVIGDDIEGQFARYDEGKEVCIDMTDKLQKEASKIIKFTTWVNGRRPYYGNEAVGESVTFDHVEGKPTKVIEEGNMLHVFGTIDEIAEYMGYDFEDGSWKSHYNPDSKWDWYQIGGRWSNMLITVDNPKYPEKIVRGEEPNFGFLPGYSEPEPRPEKACDGAAFCDIDWEAIAEKRRNDSIIRFEEFMGKNPILKEGMTIDEAHEVLGEDSINDPFYLWGKDHVPTRKEIENEAYALTTYALVKDGIWYQKGEMGWFGISSNEKTCAEWQELFEKVIDGIPEGTLVTIVDCHI